MTESRQRPTWAKWFMVVAAILMWISVLVSGLTGSLGWWEPVGAAFVSLAMVLVWLGK